MITGLGHVQVAIPRGGEAEARDFYTGILGMIEVPKPPEMAIRGGCWFQSGSAVLHLGVEEPFAPALKAHPCFVVSDLAEVRAALESGGHSCTTATDMPGVLRFHAHDVFGNRLEFEQSS